MYGQEDRVAQRFEPCMEDSGKIVPSEIVSQRQIIPKTPSSSGLTPPWVFVGANFCLPLERTAIPWRAHRVAVLRTPFLG
jgi:hypothetical protein